MYIISQLKKVIDLSCQAPIELKQVFYQQIQGQDAQTNSNLHFRYGFASLWVLVDGFL